MANVLTDLASDIQRALEINGRSAVGFIPSVALNAGSEAAAQGQTVRSLTTVEGTVNESATPAMTVPEGDDNTYGNDTMTLNKVVNAQIPFTGEDVRFLNGGVGFETAYGAIFQRKINGMMKKIEAHVAATAYQGASRAVGTAGTTPFGSNFNIVAEARQILFDNDMPVDDGMVSMVLNSSAGTNLRNLAQLQKANEAGGSELLRQGTLLDLQGVMLKESSQITTHTKGSGSSYQLSAAGSVGDTSISVDTGSGTLLAGDVVTFAGTSTKYVANSALAAGSFTIGKPGLLAAEADNDAITIGNNFTPNVMFHRDAVELAVRPMAGSIASAATDVEIFTDPLTGITIQVEVYGGYKKAMIDMTLVYGAKVWTPAGVAVVMG